MESDWITVKEATSLTGYSPDHIRDLAAASRIVAKKVATVWLVSKKSLLSHQRDAEGLGKKRGPKRGT